MKDKPKAARAAVMAAAVAAAVCCSCRQDSYNPNLELEVVEGVGLPGVMVIGGRPTLTGILGRDSSRAVISRDAGIHRTYAFPAAHVRVDTLDKGEGETVCRIEIECGWGPGGAARMAGEGEPRAGVPRYSTRRGLELVPKAPTLSEVVAVYGEPQHRYMEGDPTVLFDGRLGESYVMRLKSSEGVAIGYPALGIAFTFAEDGATQCVISPRWDDRAGGYKIE